MNRLKTSFRTRLFAAMLLSSLIPMFLSSALVVQIARLQMDGRTGEEAERHTDTLVQSMDELSNAMYSAAEALMDSEIVVQSLKGSWGNRLQMNGALFDATDKFRNFAVFDLYDAEGLCRYSTRGSVSGNLPTDWGVLYGAANHAGRSVYYASENPEDTASPLMLGAIQLREDDRALGYLVMRVYLAGFHNLTDGKYPQSDIFILSSYFHPIFSSKIYLTETLAPVLREKFLSGVPMDDDEYICNVTYHSPTGLYLVLRQPRIYTEQTQRMIITTGAICALICVGLTIAVSSIISRQVYHPVRRLSEAFDRLKQDDLETRVEIDSADEIGRLAGQFNRMVSALKTNREELLRNQQELNEAQIRMLQAQLNPHFLCNTLDTMKWISKINKVPQVAVMSTNLADILRFCISAEEFVPLYREVGILERYIEIQRIRLSDDFAFDIRIPEELYDCMIPKMILQPIVENAILHGLDNVAGSTICVSAEETEDRLLRITVADNGKGFPPELTGRPYHGDKTLAKGHLGLYNVDTILKRYYGGSCGLYLDCGPGGVGASVTAVLPVHYEEETEC